MVGSLGQLGQTFGRLGAPGKNGVPGAAAVDGYQTALLALTPSAYWMMDDDTGTTTFTDNSGNGLTATVSGNIFAGWLSACPAAPLRRSICLGTTGLSGTASLASSASLDKTVGSPFSVVTTFYYDGTSATAILFSKFDVAASRGYQLVKYLAAGTYLEFTVSQDGSNHKGWQVDLTALGLKQGNHHITIAWDSVMANAPSIYIDGAAMTLSTLFGAGTVTAFTNSAVFMIGGRSDGNNWAVGCIQDLAFFGAKLTTLQQSSLYTAYSTRDASAAIPIIYDTDGGSTDIGDLTGHACLNHLHFIGAVNIIGMCITCGDDYTAPGTRSMLDFYGLTGVPLGAYQGSDIHVGGGATAPGQKIRDRDLPTKTRADYSDPATFYSTVLTAAADNSVLVVIGGFANSISTFLNASAGNRTLWNQKVRAVSFTAGQWPNSSSSASPAGNFNPAGRGEWNLGGSGADPEGATEAQAAIDLVTYGTGQPHYWHGGEICGNTGNNPLLSEFIKNALPSDWTTTNPIRFGFGATARTSWDPLGLLAAVLYLMKGTSNPFYSVTQISTPTIDPSGADVAQNSSVSGTDNHYYFVPKTGGYTTAQWRTWVTSAMYQYVWKAT